MDEQDRMYGGIYAGKMTDQLAKEEVESADMCLIIGRMDSDLKWVVLKLDSMQTHAETDVDFLSTGMFSSKFPADVSTAAHV